MTITRTHSMLTALAQDWEKWHRFGGIWIDTVGHMKSNGDILCFVVFEYDFLSAIYRWQDIMGITMCMPQFKEPNRKHKA